MLVATLSLLISMLIGGGNISAFIVDDLPKEIKKNISDKERQKEILAPVKAYEKEFKSTQKSLNKSKKKMKKLNLDKNTSSSDINKVLNEVNDTWQAIQATGIKSRSEALALMTEEEWQQIISKSLEDYDKKEIKKQEKAYKNFEKKFASLEQTLTKEITDPERLEKILETLNYFKLKMKNYVEANMNRTLKEMGEFGDMNATEDELKKAFSVLDQSRNEFMDGIEKLHFDLAEYTTDEEWAKVSKSVNKIF